MTDSPRIPQAQPNIGNDSDLQKALDDVMRNGSDVTGAVNAGAAAVAAGASTSDSGSTDWVLRTPNTKKWEPVYGAGADKRLQVPNDYRTERTIPGVTSPLDSFKGEYAKLIEDPAFESWLVTRGWAFGKNLITKDGRFNAAAGRTFWEWLGNQVAENPDVQRSVTPEQYADSRYLSLGGDDAFVAAGGSTSETAQEEQNPITSVTQVARSTMNKSAAEAAVDDLARNLLGRMASEKELVRYRKAINAFLSKNPTVSTTTTDRTDPDNVKMSTSTKGGASEADAVNVLEMRLRRSSEGMAYNVGTALEQALTGMDRGA